MGFQKNDFFLGGGGYEDFVVIIWGSSHNWTDLGSFLCILEFILRVNVQDGVICLWLFKFQTFLAMPDILDIFGGKQ